MAPLFTASVSIDEHRREVFTVHRGRYWLGCDLSAKKHMPSQGCTADSLVFSENDLRWLAKLRPLIAAELGDASLSAQALSGVSPSLDRILLLCARLACLGASAAGASSSHEVLVVGGGPVGLMAAIQARLVGLSSVTVWEKRSLHLRLRSNVVDLSESGGCHKRGPGAPSPCGTPFHRPAPPDLCIASTFVIRVSLPALHACSPATGSPNASLPPKF